ncbi:hypothetical protein Lal_00048398 [Lupinus albus]|nr:hypothetical protein Lal_00048398 [Lupinus albus]
MSLMSLFTMAHTVSTPKKVVFTMKDLSQQSMSQSSLCSKVVSEDKYFHNKDLKTTSQLTTTCQLNYLMKFQSLSASNDYEPDYFQYFILAKRLGSTMHFDEAQGLDFAEMSSTQHHFD